MSTQRRLTTAEFIGLVTEKFLNRIDATVTWNKPKFDPEAIVRLEFYAIVKDCGRIEGSATIRAGDLSEEYAERLVRCALRLARALTQESERSCLGGACRHS